MFRSFPRLILTLLLAQWPGQAVANVEKTIFVAPDPSTMPNASPNLDNLCLEPLAPSLSTLHKLLPVRFPSKLHPLGRQSWYLLKGLRPGTRYEVRVCWAATVSATPSTGSVNSPSVTNGLAAANGFSTRYTYHLRRVQR